MAVVGGDILDSRKVVGVSKVKKKKEVFFCFFCLFVCCSADSVCKS